MLPRRRRPGRDRRREGDVLSRVRRSARRRRLRVRRREGGEEEKEEKKKKKRGKKLPSSLNQNKTGKKKQRPELHVRLRPLPPPPHALRARQKLPPRRQRPLRERRQRRRGASRQAGGGGGRRGHHVEGFRRGGRHPPFGAAEDLDVPVLDREEPAGRHGEGGGRGRRAGGAG